jgi:Rrf2 family iron-sulfur cluster assembly transcriptional regulator
VRIKSLRLSTKGQYAVRAMVNLACHSGQDPVTLKDISADEGISLSYLEQLFVNWGCLNTSMQHILNT